MILKNRENSRMRPGNEAWSANALIRLGIRAAEWVFQFPRPARSMEPS